MGLTANNFIYFHNYGDDAVAENIDLNPPNGQESASSTSLVHAKCTFLEIASPGVLQSLSFSNSIL